MSYLQAHMNRRHNSSVLTMVPFGQQQPQAEAHPKEKTDIEKELDKIKEKLHQTEIELHQERNARLSNAKDDMLLKKMEQWKNEQNIKHTNDINTIKDKFMKEIDELQMKNSNAERALYDMQSRQMKTTNVGWLKDENEIDKNEFMRQKNELDMLKAKVFLLLLF
jgi:hypothetical protein